MPTRESGTRLPGVEEERDKERENILGNLMIAHYQADKLRSRLSERMRGYGRAGNKKASSNGIKHNDKWYKVTVRIDDMAVSQQDLPDVIA